MQVAQGAVYSFRTEDQEDVRQELADLELAEMRRRVVEQQRAQHARMAESAAQQFLQVRRAVGCVGGPAPPLVGAACGWCTAP